MLSLDLRDGDLSSLLLALLFWQRTEALDLVQALVALLLLAVLPI